MIGKILNMLYKNKFKILSFIFIIFFYFVFNTIQIKKIYQKHYQFNTEKDSIKHKNDNNYKFNIEFIKKIKKVIYSVIIGDYDNISNFTKQEGYNYFLFSDIIYNNTNWTIIPISKLIEKTNISYIKMTRYFKLFPHLFFKEYELSIYLDASYIINGDLNELLLRALNPSFDLYFIQHPIRNNISQELSAVIEYKKDSKESVNIVRKRYNEENFPDNLILTQNSIIIRRHNNKNIIKLMEIWWNEIKKYSYRDQLSLNYALWKLNLNIKIYYLSLRFILDYFYFQSHSKSVEY